MTIKRQMVFIKELLALKEVVEVGQIQRAAARNGFCQPNLSHLIKDLENRTGEILFERTCRGVVPTASCKRLYGKVLFLHALINELEKTPLTQKERETK